MAIKSWGLVSSLSLSRTIAPFTQTSPRDIVTRDVRGSEGEFWFCFIARHKCPTKHRKSETRKAMSCCHSSSSPVWRQKDNSVVISPRKTASMRKLIHDFHEYPWISGVDSASTLITKEIKRTNNILIIQDTDTEVGPYIHTQHG